MNQDENERYQAAFENAVDCLCYGYGKEYWNSCGLSEEEAKEAWEEAKGFIETF